MYLLDMSLLKQREISEYYVELAKLRYFVQKISCSVGLFFCRKLQSLFIYKAFSNEVERLLELMRTILIHVWSPTCIDLIINERDLPLHFKVKSTKVDRLKPRRV